MQKTSLASNPVSQQPKTEATLGNVLKEKWAVDG